MRSCSSFFYMRYFVCLFLLCPFDKALAEPEGDKAHDIQRVEKKWQEVLTEKDPDKKNLKVSLLPDSIRKMRHSGLLSSDASFHLVPILTHVGHHVTQADLVVKGKEEQKLRLAGTFSFYVELPVLKRRMNRGERITEDDLTRKKIKHSTNLNRAVKEKDDLVGAAVVARVLQPGEAIGWGSIRSSNVVPRGSKVTLTFKPNPSILIKWVGKTLKEGRVGGQVSVVTPSKKRLVGRLTSLHQVELPEV